MAGKVGYAKVEFNGEEKLLKFDFEAMCNLEELFDKGIAAIMDNSQMGFRTIRGLYWAGLKWKMPGLTVQRVSAMLQQKLEDEDISIADLMIPVKKAIMAAGWIKSADQEEQGETDPKN